MVVTNQADVAERIRLLRAHGSLQRYHHVMVGTNSRLDELQAAILRVKLLHLDAWNRARRQHADTYTRLFHETGLAEVTRPVERPGYQHTFHLYTLRCPRRDAIAEQLRRQVIGAQVYYPLTLPQQPALVELGYRPGQLPAAQQAALEVLSLPLYPELRPEQLSLVVEKFAQAWRQTEGFDRLAKAVLP